MQLFNNNANTDMTKILIYSTQLAANYESWENLNDIQSILDMKKNSMCQMLKIVHPEFDEKTIKCIILGLYIHMYSEINNTSNIF